MLVRYFLCDDLLQNQNLVMRGVAWVSTDGATLDNSLSRNDRLYFLPLGRMFTYCTAQLDRGHMAAGRCNMDIREMKAARLY